MIKNLKFGKVNNVLQEHLKSDIEQTKNNNSADKCRNTWSYKKKKIKLLKEDIAKTCKKLPRKNLFNINRTSKKILEKLPISDRIDKMQETEAYITIKDHKENLLSKISCHLINPSKSIKVSKVILDKINNTVQSRTSVNQ